MVSQYKKEMQFLKNFAMAWNNLNIIYIESYIYENIIYKSQWVLMPINGKKDFLRYLNAKFIAIKEIMKSESMTISAVLAFQPLFNCKPCVILTQITNNGIRKVTVLIYVKYNLISRITICYDPHPDNAILINKIS